MIWAFQESCCNMPPQEQGICGANMITTNKYTVKIISSNMEVEKPASRYRGNIKSSIMANSLKGTSHAKYFIESGR